MSKSKKNKVYVDFEKEGILVGELHQFIKIDKKIDKNIYKKVLEQISPSIKKVVIFADSLQKDRLISLIKFLIENKHFIIVETNAADYNEEIIKYADFISLNLVTPSAGTNLPENQFDILSKYIFNHPYVQIKAVISNEEDLEYAIDIFSLIHDKHPYTPLVFTPCWEDDIPSKELINLIKERLVEEGMDYVRVILQQHKMVYGSSMKGV